MMYWNTVSYMAKVIKFLYNHDINFYHVIKMSVNFVLKLQDRF